MNEIFSRDELSSGEIDFWLNSQIEEGNFRRNEMIGDIGESLNLNALTEEEYYDENFTVIPISGNVFTERLNLSRNSPFQFLLLVSDENNVIRKGELVLFYPEEENVTSLPENFISKIFIENKAEVDGIFTLISLDDVAQYELLFEDGELATFKLWEARAAIELPLTCTDWYELTTIYYGDGTVEFSVIFLETVCTGGTTGGMGGGGSYGGSVNNQEGEPISVSRNYLVKKVLTSYENWEVIANYTLSGTRFNSPVLNEFNSNGCVPGATSLNQSGAQGSPSHNYYTTWTEISKIGQVINSNKTAKGVISGSYAQPNINNYNTISTPKFWQAATEL